MLFPLFRLGVSGGRRVDASRESKRFIPRKALHAKRLALKTLSALVTGSGKFLRQPVQILRSGVKSSVGCSAEQSSYNDEIVKYSIKRFRVCRVVFTLSVLRSGTLPVRFKMNRDTGKFGRFAGFYSIFFSFIVNLVSV